MQILFAVAVLSVCALLWASWAIARHVRKAASAGQKPGNLTAENIFEKHHDVSNIEHKESVIPMRRQPHGRPWSSNDAGDLSDPYQRPRSVQRRAAH